MADTYLVGALPKAHQEVVWLDVAVDEALAMYKLNARDLCRAARSLRQSASLPLSPPLYQLHQSAAK